MRIIRQLVLATLAGAGALHAQQPSLTGYLMSRDAEIALARSAAPAGITDRATIKVFTGTKYDVAREGDNGFVCLVLRGWAAPTFSPAQFRDFVHAAAIRAPICYNPVAARTVLPYQELRAKLAVEGKSLDQITAGVESAYARGALPRMETAGVAYMFSADQNLGPGIGAFHPHVMVFTPYYDNATLGGNAFGGPFPFLSDDAGTPFAVTVIPVDHQLAIHVR
jgi:hypothetical protein